MYYILFAEVEDIDHDAILEGGSIYLERIDCGFNEGLSLPTEDILSPIKFEVALNTLRGKMTDHLCMPDIPGPVFSQKVKDLLDELGISNIEYFPLLIRDEFPEGPSNEPVREEDEDEKKFVEYTEYYIANVVGLVDCVDHEKSELEYFYPPEMRNPDPENPPPPSDDGIEDPFADENPNDIDFITKLVLDESKIDPSIKVFRLKDQPDLLVFHESIVDQLRSEHLSGFVFVPVDQYTDVMVDEEETVE